MRVCPSLTRAPVCVCCAARGVVVPTLVNELRDHVGRVLGSGLEEEKDDGMDVASTKSSTTLSANSLVSALDDEAGTSANVASIIGDKEFTLAVIKHLKEHTLADDVVPR